MSTFYKKINGKVGDIVKVGSRLSSPEGVLVYSPNCQRAVNVPRRPQGVSIPAVDAKVGDVWAHEEPGVPFQSLKIGSHIRHWAGFSLPLNVIDAWIDVERTIRFLTTKIEYLYQIPANATVMNGSAVTCIGPFEDLRDFKRGLMRTRGWFNLHLASLSYAIACAQSLDRDSFTIDAQIPGWFSRLSKFCDEIVLSGIRGDAGHFSPAFPRVGVFIDLRSPHLSEIPVDFLLRCHVPIYYPWRPEWVKDPQLARFAPHPSEMQLATTIIHKSPQSVPAPNDKRPWLAFFARRQQKVAALIANETPRQKQSRLDLARNPPTNESVKVFVWEMDAQGNYPREEVERGHRMDVLSEYGVNQRVFCPVFIEWDCGPGLGLLTTDEKVKRKDDDDNDMSGYLAARRDDQPLAPIRASSRSAPDLARWNPPATNAETRHIFDIDPYHITEAMYNFFGFLAPNPVVPHPHPVEVTDSLCKQLAAIAGEQQLSPGFRDEPLAQYCLEFVRGFAKDKAPPSNLYDLSVAVHPLNIERHNRRLRTMQRFGSFGFFFTFPPSQSTLPFHLAVTNALDALFVCRLPATYSDIQVCQVLLQRGIAIRTLFSSPIIPRQSLPSLPIPIRSASYKFTRNDYLAYVEERQALLKDPRVRRAALMNGGIIWRLVISEVSFDDVYDGPTTAAILNGQGFFVEREGVNRVLCDDELSPSEADILSGLVYQYTGSGDQRSVRSWWPRHQIWKTALAAHTNWSQGIERVFLRRYDELRDTTKDIQPLTQTEWRKRLQPDTASSRMVKQATANSTKFLDMIYPRPQ